jgi:hypothetical protein
MTQDKNKMKWRKNIERVRKANDLAKCSIGHG